MQTTLTLISILLLVFQTVRAQCSGSSLDIALSTPYAIGSQTYPSSGSYTENLSCVWKLSSSSPSTEDVLIYLQINQLRANDILTIRDGTDNTGSLLFTSSTSGTSGQSLSVVARSGNAYITFTSNGVADSNQKGFTIQYMAASSMDGGGCSSPASLTATDTIQYLTSANFPSKYPSDSSCTWSISAQDSCGSIVMDFILIDLEDCVDKVTVTYDGNSTHLCPSNDWNATSAFTTTGTSASITMISDDSDHYQGFVMSYTRTGCVLPTCTYPWATGPWTDTLGRKSISFSSSSMQGYDVSYMGSGVSSWTCLDSNGDLFLSRSDSINVAGGDFYLYACMLVNTVSNTTFYYHLMSNIAASVVQSSTSLRITVKPTTDSVTDMCTICAHTPASISLPVTEYTVMTSDGTAATLGSIAFPAFAPNPCDPTTTTQAPTMTQTTTTQASSTATKTAGSTMSTNSSTDDGVIAGGIVGGLAVAVIIVLVVLVVIKMRKKL